MLSRRDLLKSVAAGAAVAAVPGAARAQAKKKPTLTIAFPSSPETIDPHQLRSVLSGSILQLRIHWNTRGLVSSRFGRVTPFSRMMMAASL